MSNTLATAASASLSRRRMLAGTSAAIATGALGHAALAKAPMLGTMAPAFYRFKLGSIEATVVATCPDTSAMIDSPPPR